MTPILFVPSLIGDMKYETMSVVYFTLFWGYAEWLSKGIFCMRIWGWLSSTGIRVSYFVELMEASTPCILDIFHVSGNSWLLLFRVTTYADDSFIACQ